MGAALSVRDASRFVIGAALLRQSAMSKSAEVVTLTDIAALIQTNHKEVVAPLRFSIERSANLAEQEGYFRNSPSHVSATEKVLSSREAEINGYNAIYQSVFMASQLPPTRAFALDGEENQAIFDQCVDAVVAIDNMPGRAENREEAIDLLYLQLAALTPDDPVLSSAFMSVVENAAINREKQAVLDEFPELDDILATEFDENIDNDYSL